MGFLLAGQESKSFFGTGSLTTSVWERSKRTNLPEELLTYHCSKGVRRVLRCVGFSWVCDIFCIFSYIYRYFVYYATTDFTIRLITAL